MFLPSCGSDRIGATSKRQGTLNAPHCGRKQQSRAVHGLYLIYSTAVETNPKADDRHSHCQSNRTAVEAATEGGLRFIRKSSTFTQKNLEVDKNPLQGVDQNCKKTYKTYHFQALTGVDFFGCAGKSCAAFPIAKITNE